MKIEILNSIGRVLHSQEVVATQVPELIRWKGNLYAHYFSHCPHGVSQYKLAVVLDMPEPLPETMVRRDVNS